MGNYKFRLSDMIPNAWFYKLKDMSNNKTRNSHNPTKKNKQSFTTSQKHKLPHLSHPRQSFYYKTWEESSSSIRTDQNLMNCSNSPRFSSTKSSDPPRRSSSSKRRSIRKTIYKPSPRRGVTTSSSSSSVLPSSQDYSLEFDFLKSPTSSLEEESFNNGLASRSSTCTLESFNGFSSSTTDIIIDVNEKSFTHLDVFDEMPELDLPPILTKPSSKLNDYSPPTLEIKLVKEERISTHRKETTTRSPGSRKSVSGIKIRANSPKLAGSKKLQGQGRKSISSKRLKSSSENKMPFSESLAVVKASFDPQKDFRDSMMEMIVENNIRASKDLEELLACYLSLNSDEYHELIIKAFEQIWFKLPHLQL